MIAIGKRTAAENTRRVKSHAGGLTSAKSQWMASDQQLPESPTVFLIEQPAGLVLPAHFHQNNQFQLFVEGNGKLGGRRITPVMVHYAGAYTAYGPIVPGEGGLKYFTMRTAYEEGGVMVQGAGDRWLPGPRRHATSKVIEPKSAAQLTELSQIHQTEIFDSEVDGYSATALEIPPAAEVLPFSFGKGTSAFLFVMAGSIINGTDELSPWESLFVGVNDAPVQLVAGSFGAQCLRLIMPDRDVAYG